jgi:hypothetical protein
MEFKFGIKYYCKKLLEVHTQKPIPYVRLYTDCRVHLTSRNGTYRIETYT